MEKQNDPSVLRKNKLLQQQNAELLERISELEANVKRKIEDVRSLIAPCLSTY